MDPRGIQNIEFIGLPGMGVRRGKLRLTLQSEFADAEPDVHSA
jgi:hypothetical protein